MNEIIENGIHYRIINFIIFASILVYFLRKPLKEFWAARSLAIKYSVEKSLRLKEEAAQKLAEVEKRYSKINDEVQSLVKAIEEETVLEKKQIEEEAKAQTKRIQEDAEKIAQQEIKRAREGLKFDVIYQSIALAEKLVSEKINSEDQQKLTDQFVAEIKEKSLQEVGGVS